MIVEDESVVADDIRNCLVSAGYAEPASVSSGEEAIEILAEAAPALILMDIHLAGSLDGIETARRIAEIADIPVVFLTAYSDTGSLERVKTVEPFGYIVKPFDRKELRCIIETALVKHERIKEKMLALEQKHRLLFERAQPMVGTDVSPNTGKGRPWPLNILTLGGFEIVKYGESIKFKGKVQQKPLALLKALVAFGGKDVAEERFLDALWPDADGDLAHRSFEMAVHRLRKLISHDGIIQLQERRLTLDTNVCQVDAWAFERAVESVERGVRSEEGAYTGKSALHNPKSEMSLDQLEKAVSVYKGPFLPADTAHPWVLSYRERLRSKFFRAIMTLGTHWEKVAQWEKAADVFQRGLDVDGHAEEFYQHLMLCYQHLGRQAEAMTVYNHCCSFLSSTFGIAPSPPTESLFQSIKNG